MTRPDTIDGVFDQLTLQDDSVPASTRASALRTARLVGYGLGFAALNTAIAYVLAGVNTFAFLSGVGFSALFAVAVAKVDRTVLLSLLSLIPAVLVVVGSVQFGIERGMDDRGERHVVTIIDHKVEFETMHSFLLRGDDAEVLPEPLEYVGKNPPYQVGDRLTVLVDIVGLRPAADVDPAGKLLLLILGVVGWTGVAVLAGWRGHRRR
ncbi:hypothetical protein GCM10009682_51840 [Luedemannella flava]|uniref:Uncharacterized protein n=1 Tax=Luedemannella flava TaxID=349316 RepID=A0ABP4YSK1_9ACTN